MPPMSRERPKHPRCTSVQRCCCSLRTGARVAKSAETVGVRHIGPSRARIADPERQAASDSVRKLRLAAASAIGSKPCESVAAAGHHGPIGGVPSELPRRLYPLSAYPISAEGRAARSPQCVRLSAALPGESALLPGLWCCWFRLTVPRMRFLRAATAVVSTLVLMYTGVAALLLTFGAEVGQTPIEIMAPALGAFYAWGPGRRMLLPQIARRPPRHCRAKLDDTEAALRLAVWIGPSARRRSHSALRSLHLASGATSPAHAGTNG